MKPRSLLLTTPNSYACLFRLIALLGLTPQCIQWQGYMQFFDLDDDRRRASEAVLCGYSLDAFLKLTIRRGIGALSPAFAIEIRR